MADIINKENLSPQRSSASPEKLGSSPVKRKGRSKSTGPEGVLEQQKPIASPNRNRRKSSFAPAPKSILPSKEDEAKRREARRKSLANRRVSFAPEATLHTWDVIEYMREATTSSTSSGDSRRTSDAPSEDLESDLVDVPSTPDGNASPAQKQRRRSSVIPPLNFNDPDEDFSSSPVSGSSAMDGSEDDDESADLEDDAEGEDQDGSPMSIDAEEPTATLTGHSNMSSGTSDSSTRLAAALEQAAERAGTRGIEYDEFGYHSDPDLEEDEEGPAELPQQEMLTPMAKNLIAFQDQENVNPFSPAFRAHAGRPSTIAEEEEADASMDMTRAVGGIIQFAPVQASDQNPSLEDATMDFTQAVGQVYQPSPVKSALKRRHSTTDEGSPMTSTHGGESQESEMGRPTKRRRSSAELSSAGDGTMDFTTAFGAIQQDQSRDATMDFTQAVGTVVPKRSPLKLSRRQSVRRRRSSVQSVISNDQTMDFTVALGGIQHGGFSPAKLISDIVEEEETGVLDEDANEEMSMELTTALGNVINQQEQATTPSLAQPATPRHLSSPLQEEPPTTPKDQGRFREATDMSAKKTLTPFLMKEAGLSPLPSSVQIRKSPASSQKMTPVGREPASPKRTPLNVPPPVNTSAIRTPSISPQRGLYPDLTEAKKISTPTHSPEKRKALSAQNTPKTPTTPERKVSPIKSVEPPYHTALNSGVKQETLASPLRSPEKPATNMMDTIRSMTTPRKEVVPTTTPLKRLKEMTPKKTPLSKVRTPRGANAPKVQFTAVSPEVSTRDGMVTRDEMLSSLTAQKPPKQKITLNSFLANANIRFLDLTASKRRYTAAPTPSTRARFNATSPSKDAGTTFISTVVAGACTVPELDLYAHACRELKKYMNEGRGVLKELEREVGSQAPPFMASYMAAEGEKREKMDTLLGEMKTMARLGSKEVWYAWRRDLLMGLETGLREIEKGLSRDEDLLLQREGAVDVLEGAMKDVAALRDEVAGLEEAVERERGEDPEALEAARRELVEADAEATERRQTLERLEAELEEQERLAELYVDSKTEALSAIDEANRVKEASRGISVEQAAAYQAQLSALEQRTDWRITSATATTLTLTYASTLQLFFTPSAFKPGTSTASRHDDDDSSRTNAPISLTHLPTTPPTTTQRFFLQLLRAHLQMLHQPSTALGTLLPLVARTWTLALATSETVRRLALAHPTEVSIRDDETLEVTLNMLLAEVRTLVVVGFELKVGVGARREEGGGEVGQVEGGGVVVVRRRCWGRVAYGEGYKEAKMGSFLEQRLGEDGGLEGAEVAVAELRARLERTGRKG